MAYCRKCGEQIDDEAVICPKCGVPQKDLTSGSSMQRDYDDVTEGMPILSAIIPIVGIIMGIVYSSQYKRRASKQCFAGAAIGIGIGIVILLIGSTM